MTAIPVLMQLLASAKFNRQTEKVPPRGGLLTTIVILVSLVAPILVVAPKEIMYLFPGVNTSGLGCNTKSTVLDPNGAIDGLVRLTKGVTLQAYLTLFGSSQKPRITLKIEYDD